MHAVMVVVFATPAAVALALRWTVLRG
jgi:hypothetical protein